MNLNRNNIVFANNGKGCRTIVTGPKATSVLVRCNTGASGSSGFSGYTGPTGPTGYTGYTGPIGPSSSYYSYIANTVSLAPPIPNRNIVWNNPLTQSLS
jgi:hypothetical protein